MSWGVFRRYYRPPPPAQSPALGRLSKATSSLEGPTGLASETDTALGLASARPAGLSTEADAALGLASARPLGLSSEAETALGLAGARPSGLASEADEALALAALVIAAVGLATEGDEAFALTAVLIAAVGLAIETDEALELAAADDEEPPVEQPPVIESLGPFVSRGAGVGLVGIGLRTVPPRILEVIGSGGMRRFTGHADVEFVAVKSFRGMGTIRRLSGSAVVERADLYELARREDEDLLLAL